MLDALVSTKNTLTDEHMRQADALQQREMKRVSNCNLHFVSHPNIQIRFNDVSCLTCTAHTHPTYLREPPLTRTQLNWPLNWTQCLPDKTDWVRAVGSLQFRQLLARLREHTQNQVDYTIYYYIFLIQLNWLIHLQMAKFSEKYLRTLYGCVYIHYENSTSNLESRLKRKSVECYFNI